jgi:16S rRNA (cytidine1402-2'-O)-methyltransferase
MNNIQPDLLIMAVAVILLYLTNHIGVKGTIYLIPVTLGGDDYKSVIPEKVLDITRQLRHFVVENTRSARRYLRLIDKQFPIDESHFYELNEHTREEDLVGFLEPAAKGLNIGLMSEAGLPGIADPGANIIRIAHSRGIRVIPLSGPSSIVLALISSGLNGQNFSFNGYLPVKQDARELKLKELEKKARTGHTQIFMETPYRSRKMIESILQVCQRDTLLCIAADITLPTESIRTMPIAEWKKNPPLADNRLVVFVLQ